MAFTTLVMLNSHTGQTRQAPVGFSWTSLFFSFLVPAFRSHWGACALWAVATVCTSGFAGIVQGFIYNKQYINHLINNGYKVKDSAMDIEFVASKLKMPLPVINNDK